MLGSIFWSEGTEKSLVSNLFAIALFKSIPSAAEVAGLLWGNLWSHL